MGIVISKDTRVDVGEEYIFYDLAMFSCKLGEVIEKLRKYDDCESYGYNVCISGEYQIRLFSYNKGKVYPYDFYHEVDNFSELPKIIDENNSQELHYDEQWCVDEYCKAIDAPEKAELLIKARKGE